MLLMRRGWKATSEVRLKLSAMAQPLPDLIADAQRIELPSPTRPFDLCIEIVSPGDDLRQVFQKSAHYIDWGIRNVWIIDPERPNAYVMTIASPVPVAIDATGKLTATSSEATLSLPLAELFAEVDEVLNG